MIEQKAVIQWLVKQEYFFGSLSSLEAETCKVNVSVSLKFQEVFSAMIFLEHFISTAKSMNTEAACSTVTQEEKSLLKMVEGIDTTE